MNIRDMIYNQRSELQNKIDMSRYGEEYFEDILIEGLYDLSIDNFTIVTESIGEKIVEIKDNLIKKIKELAIKFKNWILNLIRNIELKFKTGKMIFNKYKSQIEEQYKKRASKIKIRSKKYKFDDQFLDMFKKLTVEWSQNKIHDQYRRPIDNPDYTYIVDNSIANNTRVVKSDGSIDTNGVKEMIESYYYGDNAEIKERTLKEAIDVDLILFLLESGKNNSKYYKMAIANYEKSISDKMNQIKNTDENNFKSTEEFNRWVSVMTQSVKTGTALNVAFAKETFRVYKDGYKFAVQVAKKLLNLKEAEK